MKTIATFWKTEEAHLLRLRLGECGILAFVQDEHITQLHPWRAAAIGGVRVQVEDSDFDEAERILSQSKFQPVVGNTPVDSEVLECCACRSVMSPEETRCPSCGWSYKDGGEEG